MVAVYGDADAMRWVGDGKPLDRDACRRWIDVTARNYRERGYGMCAVELGDGGNVVGFCGLVHPNGQAEAELKYALHREYWGNGYASEVAAGMLRYGADLGLGRIIATVATEHAASQRVLSKIGMRRSHLRTHEEGATAVFVWSR